MANVIEQFRQRNGGLTDLSDDDIAEFLHQKYASDTPFADFKAFAGRAEPEEQAGTFGSYVGIPLKQGLQDIKAAAGYAAEASGLAPETGREWQSEAQSEIARLESLKSPEARTHEPLITTDPATGEYRYGGYDVGEFAQDVSRSAPAMLGIGVTGGLGATALGAGAIGTGIAMGAAEGLYSGAQNAAQTQQNYRNTPFDKLVDNPAFVEAYHNETDPTLDQNTRLEQTRDILARRAGDEVFRKTAATTGAIGAVTGGGALGQMVTGARGGILARAAKGFTKEAGQEVPQSAGEQYIQNVAEQKYLDPNIDPYKDVLTSGVEGGLVGGAMGLGGVFSPSRDAQPVDRPVHALSDAQATEVITAAPTVDDAIAAAGAALESAPVDDAIISRADALVDLPELGTVQSAPTEMLPSAADSIEPMPTAQSLEPTVQSLEQAAPSIEQAAPSIEQTAQSIEQTAPVQTAQSIEQTAPVQTAQSIEQTAPMQTAPSIEPAQSATLSRKRQQVADLVNAGMPVRDAWREVRKVDLKSDIAYETDLNRFEDSGNDLNHNESSGSALNHFDSQTPFTAAAKPTPLDLSTRASGIAGLNSMPVTTPAEASAFLKAHSAFTDTYKATPKNISAKLKTAKRVVQTAPLQEAKSVVQTAPEPAENSAVYKNQQLSQKLPGYAKKLQDKLTVVSNTEAAQPVAVKHRSSNGQATIDLSSRAKGIASLNAMPVSSPAEVAEFVRAVNAFTDAYTTAPKNIDAKLRTATETTQPGPVQTAKSEVRTAPMQTAQSEMRTAAVQTAQSEAPMQTAQSEMRTAQSEAPMPVTVKQRSSEAPVQSAKTQAESWLPKYAKRMVDEGKLVIAENHEEAGKLLEQDVPSFSGGFYNPEHDRVVMIANQYTDKELMHRVLNHELLHRAEFVDPTVKATMARLNDKFEARFKLAKQGKGSAAEQRAYKVVTGSSTPDNLQLIEFRAYLVSEYNRNPNSLTGYVKKLVQDFIAAIRIGLMRAGVQLKDLTAADLNRIAETYGVQAERKSDIDAPLHYNSETDINAELQQAGDAWLRQLMSQPKRDTAIYKLQDRYIDLKRQIERIRNTGEAIPESEDAYQAEELYHQRQASRIKDFYDNELTPILIALHDADITIEQFESYLHARHAPSRNKVMAERNPSQVEIDKNLNKAVKHLAAVQQSATVKELSEATREVEKWKKAQPFQGTEEQRLSLSGMTDADAAKIIRDVPAAKRSTYEELGAKIDAITERTHQLLVDYGMETEQSAKQLKGEWDHYVPLYRDEAHLDSVGHPQGQGFSVRGTGIKSATGSNEKVTNILGHIAASREQYIKRGEKNRVTAALANFIKAHPDAEFAEVGKIPTREVIENGLVKTEPVPMYMNANNVVVMRVRGQNIGIVFNEKNLEAVRLALSLKNMDGADLGKLTNLVAIGTRFIAKMSTQYNVVFGIVNAMRDTQSVLLNLSTTELRGRQRQVIGKLFESSKAIWAVERGNAGVDPAMRKMYDRFNKAGGTTGFTQMFEDIQERQDSIKKEYAKLDGVTAKNALPKLISIVGKGIEDYNTLMENSARFAAFQVGIESGLSDAKAASIAKNISVNFNRKGAISTWVGSYFTFVNAAIQGNARTYETLRGPRGKQIMSYGVAIGAAMTAMAIAAMGEDDWEKIPEYVRERNLIIPTGGASYVKIPMPLGFHILPNIGRKLVELAMGSDRVSPTARILQLMGSTLSAFNPLGGDGVDALVPSVLDPVVSLWRNQDWRGQAVYKEDFNSLDPTPGFTRKKDTASGFSTTLAEYINKATGGTDYTVGAWSPTPDELDYIFKAYMGGTGGELLNAEQSIEAVIEGTTAELPVHKIPLLGKLYGKASGPSVERGLYYDNLKRLNAHAAEIEGLRSEQGGAAKAAKYIREEPEAKLVQRGKAIEKTINGLMRRRKELKAKNPNAPGLKLLDKRIADQQKLLNDLMAAA